MFIIFEISYFFFEKKKFTFTINRSILLCLHRRQRVRKETRKKRKHKEYLKKINTNNRKRKSISSFNIFFLKQKDKNTSEIIIRVNKQLN
jgi:hypothetical protein